MNYSFLKIFLLLVVLSGCSKKESRPKDVLQPEKMEDVLWDMSLADEFVVNYIMKDSVLNKKNESTKRYQQIFTIHKTNLNDFKKSLRFYEDHPLLFKPILDSLNARQQTSIAEQYKPKTPATMIPATIDSSKINRNKPDTAKPPFLKRVLKRKKSLRRK
jgi:Domain of unknown function (DUF4296)